MTTTPDDMFRTWLARIARERRLSRGQLAMRAGVDRSTVSRILSGEREPTLNTAMRLIRAFDDGSMPPMLARLKRVEDLTGDVEDALRRDPLLTPSDRAEVMRFYHHHRQADP